MYLERQSRKPTNLKKYYIYYRALQPCPQVPYKVTSINLFQSECASGYITTTLGTAKADLVVPRDKHAFQVKILWPSKTGLGQ